MVFDRIGIPGAAGIVNFVVLTAALSSCNSGIFSTGRMLYTLAGFRQAPAVLRQVSRQKVPAVGLVASFGVMLIGVAINYFIPGRAFTYITSVATVCGLFVWGMIVFTHLRYRRAVDCRTAARKRASACPARRPRTGSCSASSPMVLVLLAFNKDTVIALYVAPVWVLVLVVGYFASRSHHVTSTREPAATGAAAAAAAATAAPAAQAAR